MNSRGVCQTLLRRLANGPGESRPANECEHGFAAQCHGLLRASSSPALAYLACHVYACAVRAILTPEHTTGVVVWVKCQPRGF
jgi:hypothetical protein